MGDVYKELPINKIEVTDNFTRTSVKAENVGELMVSMKQQGLLQPIIVKKNGTGYHLIAGHSRLNSAKKLGWKTIPASIRTKLDGEQDAIDSISVNISENSVRVAPSFFEEGRGLAMLRTQYDMEPRQISARTGLTLNRINRCLYLWDSGVPAQYRRKIVPDRKAVKGSEKSMIGKTTYSIATQIKNSSKEYEFSRAKEDKLWRQAINKGATRDQIKGSAHKIFAGKKNVASDIVLVKVNMRLSVKKVKAYQKRNNHSVQDLAKSILHRNGTFKNLIAPESME